jgi:hypothetical protein
MRGDRVEGEHKRTQKKISIKFNAKKRKGIGGGKNRKNIL